MTYDAVSAYTVLLGDGDGPATVSVHGSAADAWAALAAALGRQQGATSGSFASTPPAPQRSTRRFRRRLPVPRPNAPVAAVPSPALTQAEVEQAAEAWRRDEPGRRFWQVNAHRLQVTVPAINTGPIVSRSEVTPAEVSRPA